MSSAPSSSIPSSSASLRSQRNYAKPYPVLVQPPVIAVQHTMPTAPIPRPWIHGKNDDVCCACWDRCTALPSTETRDMATNGLLRINFTYWDRHCCACGPHPGVAEQVQDQHCPEEVIQAAIVNCGGNPVIELKQEPEQLEKINEEPGRVLDIRKELIDIWDEYLGQDGMLFHCWVTITYDGDGRPQKNRHFRRWIALALTPEQSALLAGEPHISGDVEVDLCCGGVNELALSMHPPNGMLF
ncbi:unnamed protein product [Amoebophrya sp. A120]|nr:unnamed protein product [Amoebophrya sp. A120]|eukprot:GSA120T00022562001.1